VKGCKTCEREGDRPHKNGKPNRCPEALMAARVTQKVYTLAHPERERDRWTRKNGTFARWLTSRKYRLRSAREETLAKLAELHREEMDLWHSYQAQQTQTR
jgi:hypothetical protein